jgi:hypothetical protein
MEDRINKSSLMKLLGWSTVLLSPGEKGRSSDWQWGLYLRTLGTKSESLS